MHFVKVRTKPITLKAIEETRPCSYDWVRALAMASQAGYAWEDVIPMDVVNTAIAHRDRWAAYLEDKGFIKPFIAKVKHGTTWADLQSKIEGMHGSYAATRIRVIDRDDYNPATLSIIYPDGGGAPYIDIIIEED